MEASNVPVQIATCFASSPHCVTWFLTIDKANATIYSSYHTRTHTCSTSTTAFQNNLHGTDPLWWSNYWGCECQRIWLYRWWITHGHYTNGWIPLKRAICCGSPWLTAVRVNQHLALYSVVGSNWNALYIKRQHSAMKENKIICVFGSE